MKTKKPIRVIFLIPFLLLTGCASIDNSLYRYDSKTLSHENSALVLFRTESCSLRCTTGIAVLFKNIETEEKIVNLQGFSGHSGDGFHVFWFPEGEYLLERVFFYNGGMRPATEGFNINVKAGETLYIGTILKSWGGLPKPLAEYGALKGLKQYCRGDGFNADACTTLGEVAIVDEGGEIIGEFKKRLPNINEPVTVRLLN